MKILLISCLLLCLNLQVWSQTKINNTKFNFNFEEIASGRPVGWDSLGSSNYKLRVDSNYTNSGKYSTSIEFTAGIPKYKAWTFPIQGSYKGKKITLSGFIKTENVKDGYAGLWMRIDPNLGYEDMNKVAFKGTHEWTKFEISLDLKPVKFTQILIGGLLVGKGKVWFDDFRVEIDQKDIRYLKPIKESLAPANEDKEFVAGSNLNFYDIHPNQVLDLKRLCQIWGFIKYYHPTIAKGIYNMDFELFRIIPQILNAQNLKEKDEILLKWLVDFGEIQKSKRDERVLSNIHMKPEFKWIKESDFSDKVIEKLNEIKESKRSDIHFYVEFGKSHSMAVFKNENEYLLNKYPDVGYRILALFRYWNMIEYYFPYKYIIGKDWDSILDEFIPRIVKAENELEYNLTLLELVGSINDSHVSFQSPILNQYFGLRFGPVEVQYVENQPIITGFHDQNLGYETKLKVGDIITTINGESQEKRTEKMLKQWSASNYPTQLRDIARDFLRTNDSIINIQIKRNDTVQNHTIKTYSLNEINLKSRFFPADTCFRMINQEIAYIKNCYTKKSRIPKIWEQIKNTNGLIIDNRNYPTEDIYNELCNYLLPKKTPFVKFSLGSVKYPGLFTFSENITVGKDNVDYYKGKVIILVNEITQSAAEFSVMAYRTHPNAILIGSTTAGANGTVSQVYLPGRIYSRFTGIGVFYPNGQETQRVGIIPDIVVNPTINGIKSGRDELMEKAIELIKQN